MFLTFTGIVAAVSPTHFCLKPSELPRKTQKYFSCCVTLLKSFFASIYPHNCHVMQSFHSLFLKNSSNYFLIDVSTLHMNSAPGLFFLLPSLKTRKYFRIYKLIFLSAMSQASSLCDVCYINTWYLRKCDPQMQNGNCNLLVIVMLKNSSVNGSIATVMQSEDI